MIIKDSKIITPDDKRKNDLQVQTAKTVNLLSEIRTELQSSKELTKEQAEASSKNVNEASELLQEVIKNSLSEQIHSDKELNKLTDDKLVAISTGIVELKDELITAINSQDISDTEFATNIEKNFSSVIDLLKQIKDKKTTFVGGGGGGSNVPMVQADNGKYAVPVVNPDGSTISGGGVSNYQSYNDPTTDANLIYLGKSLPGTLESDAGWQIKCYNIALGKMTYADDVTTFTKIWNSRTGYTY